MSYKNLKRIEQTLKIVLDNNKEYSYFFARKNADDTWTLDKQDGTELEQFDNENELDKRLANLKHELCIKIIYGR